MGRKGVGEIVPRGRCWLTPSQPGFNIHTTYIHAYIVSGLLSTEPGMYMYMSTWDVVQFPFPKRESHPIRRRWDWGADRGRWGQRGSQVCL